MNVRVVVGRTVGALAAITIASSSVFSWARNTSAIRIPIQRLASAESLKNASFTHSLSLLLIAYAILVFIFSLFKRRMLTFFFSLVSLFTLALWAGMMAMYTSPASFGAKNVQTGAWIALSGTLLGIIGSRILPKKDKTFSRQDSSQRYR